MLSLTLLALAAQCAAATSAASSNYTVAAGWYASWHVTDVPLSSVLWSKYTHMTYAFAIPTADPSAISLAESDEELLPQFVAAAHKNGVKAGLSIGGWTGSQYYSSNVASASNRTAFVKSVTNLIQKYHLDLVDFDWEYPGVQGIGCNIVSSSDTDNFLAMLQELRASPIAGNVTLTAATAVVPFPTTNTSTIAEFATVLNWIVPMVYDLSWNWTAGSPRIQRALPSAPLDDSCFESTPGVTGTGLTGRGSARSAVESWSSAGMPASQIVLGVPAYGHSFNVNASEAFLPSSSSTPQLLTPYPPYDTLNHTVGDNWDGTGGTDQCGVFVGPGGVWDFFALVAAGYLLANGSAAAGVPYQWDTCSSTPYLYAADRGVLVSYDDPRSFAAKGAFVRANGLGGFAMWEVGGDPKGVLLDAICVCPLNLWLCVLMRLPCSVGADQRQPHRHALAGGWDPFPLRLGAVKNG
ncbi:glycoside hydrolase superfamily [Mycena rosella]|uniref:Glycoside hydrolase superfamily n=1 Tax=Mycena rosella TaxID=1033263 RepID=A0AAD7CVB4_MYCRO|nr:glycoside hydrolase superfamily [Mycena rosella]